MSTNSHYKESFDELYRRYHPAVSQICKGYLRGQEEVAADLTQEVFINAWNALPRFRGEAAPKTWLYRITVNTCLLYLRGQKKRQTITLQDDHIAAPGPAEEKSAPLNRLYQAIGCLEELDRLIIMMVLEELPYGEIAEVTGITPDTLRVKIHRIKKRIKKHMEKQPQHG